MIYADWMWTALARNRRERLISVAEGARRRVVEADYPLHVAA